MPQNTEFGEGGFSRSALKMATRYLSGNKKRQAASLTYAFSL